MQTDPALFGGRDGKQAIAPAVQVPFAPPRICASSCVEIHGLGCIHSFVKVMDSETTAKAKKYFDILHFPVRTRYKKHFLVEAKSDEYVVRLSTFFCKIHLFVF
jgi:hypothetical protein